MRSDRIRRRRRSWGSWRRRLVTEPVGLTLIAREPVEELRERFLCMRRQDDPLQRVNPGPPSRVNSAREAGSTDACSSGEIVARGPFTRVAGPDSRTHHSRLDIRIAECVCHRDAVAPVDHEVAAAGLFLHDDGR
jgi:hypothetical protein